MNGMTRIGGKRPKNRIQSLVQTETENLKESRSNFETFGNSLFLGWMKKQPKMPFDACFTRPELKSRPSGCSTPSLRGPKRPKSELCQSTNQKPKIPTFGHSTATFETGNSAKRKSKMDSSPNKLLGLIFWQFRLLLLFAASLQNVTIASHNLHSFKQSGAYHKSCLEKHTGVWFAQELWLSEKQLPTLQQLRTQYIAKSGMEQSVSDGILIGRPYGGVSIAWSFNLNHAIQPLTNYNLPNKNVASLDFSLFMTLNI